MAPGKLLPVFLRPGQTRNKDFVNLVLEFVKFIQTVAISTLF